MTILIVAHTLCHDKTNYCSRKKSTYFFFCLSRLFRFLNGAKYMWLKGKELCDIFSIYTIITRFGEKENNTRLKLRTFVMQCIWRLVIVAWNLDKITKSFLNLQNIWNIQISKNASEKVHSNHNSVLSGKSRYQQ